MRRATAQARVVPCMIRAMSRLTGLPSTSPGTTRSLATACARYLRLHREASRSTFISAIEGGITVYSAQALSMDVTTSLVDS
jgi:hypothetical protein